MDFRKAYKLSLNDTQAIEKCLNGYLNGNTIEVQLLDLNDNLENMNLLAGKVTTIHMPLDKEADYLCNLSNVIKAIKEKNEYYGYINKVAEYARKESAGLVIHADMDASNGKDDLRIFAKYIEENDLTVHIENIIKEIKDEQQAVLAPLKLCEMINSMTKKQRAFPLMDICHFQMVKNRFDSSLKINLKDALTMYYSTNFVIHFNSSTGSGDERAGGIHSDNFRNNTELLDDILDYLKELNPLLVLECNEFDLVTKPKARWLNNYIEKRA